MYEVKRLTDSITPPPQPIADMTKQIFVFFAGLVMACVIVGVLLISARSNPVYPMLVYAVGTAFAGWAFQLADKKFPNSWLAQGNHVSVWLRGIVFFLGFCAAYIYMKA